MTRWEEMAVRVREHLGSRIVGLEELFQEPAIHAGFMGNGNSHHDISVTQVSSESLIGRDGQLLVPPEFGQKPSLFHIAFEMENEAELVAAHDRAVKYDVTIIMTVDHTFAKSVDLLDAERNMLEFTSDSTKDWRATYREYEGKLVTGPWAPGEQPPATERNYPVDPEIRRLAGVAVHSLRATHAVLGCNNLHEQLAFYQDVAGLDTVVYADQSEVAVLKGTAADYSLVLFQARGQQRSGYHHVAFEVSASDFDVDVEQLASAGVAIEARLDHPAKKGVFLRDPDGLGVEFYAPLGDIPAALEAEDLRRFWLVAA